MTELPCPAQKKIPAVMVDLLIIAILSLILYILAGKFDLFERIVTSVSAFESWELDELFTLSFFLVAALCVFSYHRWAEMNQEHAETIRATGTLEKLNNKLGLMTEITRHDLVNQIFIVRSFTRLALKEKPDPVVAERLSRIDRASAVMLQQIDLMKVYQEIGTHDPHWADLDEAMPRSYEPPSITFITDVQGISLCADPMLEKVFFNLLDNAIRHGERVTEIRVSARRDDGNLLVVWEDNGIGIPFNEKEKIFERGYGKNTGLGMFLAREILALTGITIHETGEPGKGARFEITVPAGQYRTSPQS